MKTTQQPGSSAATSTAQPPRTGPAQTSVTGWLIDQTAVVQAFAYLCAGGSLVALLTGATTVAWLLLAAALTADTATYRRRAGRDKEPAPPARYICASTLAEMHGATNDERATPPWHYRPLPQRR
jgi:hypothetical protein